MARTINEIYAAILLEKANKVELSPLTSTSKVAMYNLWAYIVAVVLWSNEKLFDLHVAEVDQKIKEQKLGKAEWYRDIALEFQYGQTLVAGTETYNNTGLTDVQIEAAKIIQYASVTEVEGQLRVKVAKKANNLPAQLSSGELAAFSSYIEKRKFAGVKLIKDSLPPDTLKLALDIWYNPLVLRNDGSRIDGDSQTPVKDAIKEYLNQLPFNGEYSNTRLTNYLENIDGVVFPVVKNAQAKYGLFSFNIIDEKYIPDAGYLSISDSDLTIVYKEYV